MILPQTTSEVIETIKWTAVEPLPEAIAYSQVIATRNQVYLLGGVVNDSPSSAVYTAPILSDGSLGVWTSGVPLPGNISHSQAIVTRNRVYLLGGYINGAVSSVVYTAPILDDGTLGVWSTGAPLPVIAIGSQAVTTHNRVYLLGGFSDSGGASSTAYTSPIYDDGTLGPWADEVQLPARVHNFQAVTTVSRVHLLGGHDGVNYSAAVYTAPILNNGKLGPWTVDTPLPEIIYSSRSIVACGRVHLLKGNGVPMVYTAPILDNGTLGVWSTGVPLPTTVTGSCTIATHSRVYVLGGVDNGKPSSKVYVATHKT